MLFLSLLIDQIFLYKSDSLLLDVNIIIQALLLHSLLPIKKIYIQYYLFFFATIENDA